MRKGLYIRDNRLLIQGDRLLLVLTPKEIIDAVIADEELFIRSCKRGKSELRTMANENRTQKHEQQLAEQIQKEEAEVMRNIQAME